MTRFIQQQHETELFNLWHLSKVHSHDRYQRKLWTSGQFAKQYPQYSSTAVYKDLEVLTASW